jgi:hypothetical protein
MRQLITRVTLAISLLAVPAGVHAQDHVIDEAADAEFLYVVSATSGSVEGDTLTLVGVPSVVYFSDRPARIAGHMSVEGFVAGWDGGVGSFADVPPNAVLSVLETDGVKDSVVELTAIGLEGDALTFEMVVLEGEPPEGSIGPVSLFLDPDTVAPTIT